ncbi:MAG: hypothetical protein LBF72_00545 [Holosporales bacterium]|jgi:hypothetical protein|nr:hypothetical protein [Holosporales bacterium]
MRIFDTAKFFIVLSAGMLVSSGISMAEEPSHAWHQDISAEGPGAPTKHPVVVVKEAPLQQQQSGILSYWKYYLSGRRWVNWLHLNRLNDWQVIKRISCGVCFSAFAYGVTGDLAISLATLSSFTWSALFEKSLQLTLPAVYAAVIFAKYVICYLPCASLGKRSQRAFDELLSGDGEVAKLFQKEISSSRLEDLRIHRTNKEYVLKASCDPRHTIDAVVAKGLEVARATADAKYESKTIIEILEDMGAKGLKPLEDLVIDSNIIAAFERFAESLAILSEDARKKTFFAIPKGIREDIKCILAKHPRILSKEIRYMLGGLSNML